MLHRPSFRSTCVERTIIRRLVWSHRFRSRQSSAWNWFFSKKRRWKFLSREQMKNRIVYWINFIHSDFLLSVAWKLFVSFIIATIAVDWLHPKKFVFSFFLHLQHHYGKSTMRNKKFKIRNFFIFFLKDYTPCSAQNLDPRCINKKLHGRQILTQNHSCLAKKVLIAINTFLADHRYRLQVTDRKSEFAVRMFKFANFIWASDNVRNIGTSEHWIQSAQQHKLFGRRMILFWFDCVF